MKKNHKGGWIPLLLVGLSAGATIYTAIKNDRHQAAEEAERKRHNEEMEKIAHSKKTISKGSGLKKEKKRPNPIVVNFRHWKISKKS